MELGWGQAGMGSQSLSRMRRASLGGERGGMAASGEWGHMGRLTQ